MVICYFLILVLSRPYCWTMTILDYYINHHLYPSKLSHTQCCITLILWFPLNHNYSLYLRLSHYLWIILRLCVSLYTYSALSWCVLLILNAHYLMDAILLLLMLMHWNSLWLFMCLNTIYHYLKITNLDINSSIILIHLN